MLLNGEPIKNNAAFNMQVDISGVFSEHQDKISLSDAFKLIGRDSLLTAQIKPSDEVAVTDNSSVRDKMSELTERVGLSEISDKFWERAESYVNDGYKETQRNCIVEKDVYVEFSSSEAKDAIREVGHDLYQKGFKPDEDTGYSTPEIDSIIRDVLQSNGVSEIGYNVLSEARIIVEEGYNESIRSTDVEAPETVEETIKLEMQIDNTDSQFASVSNGIGFVWPFSPENGVSSETVFKMFSIDPVSHKLNNPEFLSMIETFSRDKLSVGSFEAGYRLYENLMEVSNRDRIDLGIEPVPILSRDEVNITGLNNDDIEKKSISDTVDGFDSDSKVDHSERHFSKYDSPDFFGAKSAEEVEAFSITKTETITKKDGSTQDVTLNLAQSLRSIGRDLVYKDKISTGGELSSAPDVKARIDDTLSKFGLDHPSQSCYAKIASQVDKTYNETLSKSVQIGSHFISFDRCKVVESLSEFGTKLRASGLLEKFDKSSFASSAIGEGIVKEIFAKHGISYYGDKVLERAATIIESSFVDGVDKEPLSPKEIDDILPWALKSEYGVGTEATKALLSGVLDERLEGIVESYKLDLDNDTKLRADVTLYHNLIDYQNDNTDDDSSKVEYIPNYKLDTSGIVLESFPEHRINEDKVSSAQIYASDNEKDLNRYVDSLPGDFRILGKFIVDLSNSSSVRDVAKSVGHLFVGIAIRDLSPINDIYKTIDFFRGTTDKESSLSYNRFQLPMQEWDKRFTVERKSFSESCSILSGQREPNISNEELQSRKMAAYEGAESALSGYSDEIKEKVLDGLDIEAFRTNNDFIEQSPQDGVTGDNADKLESKQYDIADIDNSFVDKEPPAEDMIDGKADDVSSSTEQDDLTSRDNLTPNVDVLTAEPAHIVQMPKEFTSDSTDSKDSPPVSETLDKDEHNLSASSELTKEEEYKDLVSTSEDESKKAVEVAPTEESGYDLASASEEVASAVDISEYSQEDVTDTYSKDSLDQQSEDVVSGDSSVQVVDVTKDDDDAAAVEDALGDDLPKDNTSPTVGEELVQDKTEQEGVFINNEDNGQRESDGKILEDVTNDANDDMTLEDDSVVNENKDSDDGFDFSSLFDSLGNNDVTMTVELVSNLLNAESALDVGVSIGQFVTDLFESRIAEPFDNLDMLFDTGLGEKIHDFFDIIHDYFDCEQFADMFKGFDEGLSDIASEMFNGFLDDIYQNIESNAVEVVIDPSTGEVPHGFDTDVSADGTIEYIKSSIDDYLPEKLSELEFVPNDISLPEVDNSNVEIRDDVLSIDDSQIKDTVTEQMANAIENGQTASDFDGEQNFENDNVDTGLDASQQTLVEGIEADEDALEEVAEEIIEAICGG